jgi:Lrp/AsnC family leucine-responsive transcriptional regulator
MHNTAFKLSELDKTDQQILSILISEGHLSNAELAARVHLSPPACWKRLKRLEQHLIKGYYPSIEFRELGLTVNAYVMLTLEDHTETTMQQFERNVTHVPHLLSCDKVSGPYDYIVQIHAIDIAHLQTIMANHLRPCGRIKEIRSIISLREIVRRTMPNLAYTA